MTLPENDHSLTETELRAELALLRSEREMLSFNDYQVAAHSTAFYPGYSDIDSYEGLSYVTLGLVGEAGEIANKVKKIARDADGHIGSDVRMSLIAEVGDVLWYVSQLANQLGANLGWIAELNINKLKGRQQRGVLGGSGDER